MDNPRCLSRGCTKLLCASLHDASQTQTGIPADSAASGRWPLPPGSWCLHHHGSSIKDNQYDQKRSAASPVGQQQEHPLPDQGKHCWVSVGQPLVTQGDAHVLNLHSNLTSYSHSNYGACSSVWTLTYYTILSKVLGHLPLKSKNQSVMLPLWM